RSLGRAIEYETRRQIDLIEAGERIRQETRHWDENAGRTTAGRSKENSEDYRYFPEPDLVPIAPSPERVEELRATLPEPPAQRLRRLQADWGFADLEMRDVIGSGALDLIDATVTAGAAPAAGKKWWVGELSRRANADGVELAEMPITPAQVAELDALLRAGRLNDTMAKQVLDGVLAGEGGPTAVADARGLQLVSDDGALRDAVQAVIARNPDVAAKIQAGKVQASGALIGQVMKEMQGRADAAKVRTLLLESLGVAAQG
ncbi:MAG: Asp-tRNA(Asn)/Glu-tRNA(Gln) amidotransferase GatCAB subunit B, partial [Austwickia sp.]|nr:Asp-tRNA(Asn)/Glu-tRNA(Gln) amidotransferase GatCAB subunit B [Austwickia sp.]